MTRRAPIACALAALAVGAAACGGPEAAAPPPPPAPSAADRVEAHLLAHGARRARADHPGRYWFRGGLVLPRGGPTCAVAGITAGAHAPLVTDAVYDATGTVSVRIRARPADRARCLAAARGALAGL
jgi:hypothetical protein